MTQKQLLLIDGSSYLFRAYHALPPLTGPRGEPTGAVYGVVNMLKKLRLDYPTPHIAVVFDPKGRTSRYDIFPEYKANRGEAPEELVAQIKPLHAVIAAMGLPVLIKPGIEADDVMATLATQAVAEGYQVVISTGDKDMAQLVSPDITLVNTMSGTTFDEEGVVKKFGVKPTQIRDYLALIGDSSDNIPGVPKVGPKTAVKWLDAYGDIDNLLQHADDIKGKVGENLRSSLDLLTLSQTLVTLDCQVNMPFSVEDCREQPVNTEELYDWFARFGFKQWLHALESKKTVSHSRTNYSVVTKASEWTSWREQLESAKVFAFDTETTGLDAHQARLLGFSIALQANEAIYVPFEHDAMGDLVPLDKTSVLSDLAKIFQRQDLCVVGQNLKYDLTILHYEGVQVACQCFDTMLASYCLDSTQQHNMDAMAMHHLGISTTSFTEIAGKGAHQLTFNQIEFEKAWRYAAEDADVTLKLYQHFSKLLNEQAWAKQIFMSIDMPTMDVVTAMEHQGVLVDEYLLKQQSVALADEINDLEQQAFQQSGLQFNMSSPKQLREVLYDSLGLEPPKKTAKGEPSTDEESLQMLSSQHALPSIILRYRSLSKLKSTYLDKLPEQINSRTGRIHTSYNQAVTSTGRFSSTHPNLQNIPIRTPEGRRIREAFIAPEGSVIMAADYSQVELRIMAHLSKDKRLVEAFQRGEDVHAATASEIFSKRVTEVTPEQRRFAKAINFGLIYGMSAFGLARELGISRQEASLYIDRYFKQYPKVKEFMEVTREQAAKHGYVETLCGRRLLIPEIHSRQPVRRKAAERAAINAPMQGSAADIIKKAMIQVASICNHQAKMIMQVHDELVFEVVASYQEEFQAQVVTAMEQAELLDVPLLVEVGVGPHWEAAH